METYIVKVNYKATKEIKVRAYSYEQAYDKAQEDIENEVVDLLDDAEIEDWDFYDVQIIDEMR